MKKLLKHILKYIKPFFNWRFLICFMIPWMITNGIWYLGAYIGIRIGIKWLASICLGYLAWLYTPIAMEKLVIIPIALWLCKKIFRNHAKTVADLNEMYATAKADLKKLLAFLGIGGDKNAKRKRKRKLIKRGSCSSRSRATRCRSSYYRLEENNCSKG